MRKYLTLTSRLLFSLLVAMPLQAEVLSDLYSAQVRVESQGEAALGSGARIALGQVLIKASGSRELLRDAAVQDALRSARQYVQQYSYSRRVGAEAGEDELWARFEFSPSYVTTLIKKLGAPLWTANRPTVLVWLVVGDQASGRHFVQPEVTPEFTEQLLEAFSYRGVPARLPLFDLADTAALSIDDAWYMRADAVRRASSRYNLENIVVARVAQVSDGRFVGDWSYLRGAESIERSVSGETLEEFLRQGVGVVADDMAARFAVAASNVNADSLTLSVSGIKNYSDYAGVVTWIESLELVDNATVMRIDGEEMTLRIAAQADAIQLATLIELNRRLQPVPDSGFSGLTGPTLHYEWRN